MEFVNQWKVILRLYCADLGSKPDRFPSWIPHSTFPITRSLFQFFVRGVKYTIARMFELQYSDDLILDKNSIHDYALVIMRIVGSARNLP